VRGGHNRAALRHHFYELGGGGVPDPVHVKDESGGSRKPGLVELLPFWARSSCLVHDTGSSSGLAGGFTERRRSDAAALSREFRDDAACCIEFRGEVRNSPRSHLCQHEITRPCTPALCIACDIPGNLTRFLPLRRPAKDDPLAGYEFGPSQNGQRVQVLHHARKRSPSHAHTLLTLRRLALCASKADAIIRQTVEGSDADASVRVPVPASAQI
jgi:hypothetical protein